MIDLKSYFHDKYQGGESFIENVILPIFGEDKFEDAYEEDVLENNPELLKMADSTGINQILRLGTINIPMNPTDVFDITVCNQVKMRINRVTVQQLIRRIMSTYSSAFMVFHYQEDDKWDWRFSFCSKLGSNSDATDSKRYTFLLGPNQSCRTAADNFRKLAGKQGSIELKDIVEAFDVEALSSEFFSKYKTHYEKFCSYIYNNRYDETKFGRVFAECEEKTIRDYVKKLLGRLVFLQFLQKKGWLGGTSSRWDDGDRDFLQKLYKNASQAQKDDFLDAVLEPLFHRALDTNRAATNQDFDTGVDGFRCCKIPYLNGGLFSKDQGIDDANSDFPAEYFGDLFEFFYQYNFTIDENDPNDAEVGVDPEMLGRIFENLLEDNKDKGAFYTPKAIVQYMCKESLIAYLQNGCKTERAHKAARDFVESHDAEPLRQLHMEKPDGTKLKDSVLEHFDKMLRAVKVCDPAIGSGAFPMGMLRELFECRAALEDYSVSTPADIKKDIIQNNIYGVDIEKGAVDIARLRFWLTLILDEEDPHALPNLDFKIMQGNSLLESFHGVDLSQIAVGKQKATKTLKVNARTLQGSILFEDEEAAMKELQRNLRQYYSTDNHDQKKYIHAKIESATRQYLIHKTEGRPDLQAEVETLPLCNDQFFLWHTFFADVFEQGGFDIVIGNPPYIDSETMVKVMPKERELYAKKYACARGNWDMFIIFIEFSISLLKEKGIFSNIIPNKLIAAKYGVDIRKLLAAKHVIEIRDYSRIGVFEAAAVYPITIVLRNCETKDYTLFTTMDNRVVIKQSNKANSYDLAKNDYWDVFFRDAAMFKLISKINSFKPLSALPLEVLGAATVADAYEIKNIVQDSNSKDGFKLINSGTIDPYLPYWGIKPCRYIKGSYINPIVQPQDLKKYSEVRFNQSSLPKIIVASMTTRYEACLDVKGEYIAGKSTTIILGDTKNLYRLTAIINSKLASFWLNIVFNSLKMSGGAINIGRNELLILPIPEKDVDFTSLVNKIMEYKASSRSNKITAEEREIDRLVYQLYGLTEEEIRIVEGTVSK